jgi:hypothetical protein
MYSPLKLDGTFTRKNKIYENEKIIKDAQRAWWFMFVFFAVELAILVLCEWLGVAKTIWAITPIIPTSGDPDPSVRDSQVSWEFTLVNFYIFAWLAPIIILVDLLFWRKNADIMPTISAIFNVIVLVMVTISFAILIYLWSIANTAESPDNIFNSPFYCCAFFDNPAAGCPNFGTDCGATITPAEIAQDASMAGVMRFVFTLIIWIAIIGFNLIYYHLKFVPTVEILLAAECKMGFTDELQPRTNRSRACADGGNATEEGAGADYDGESSAHLHTGPTSSIVIPAYHDANSGKRR